MKKLLALIPLLLAPILATLLTTSCEVDSASDVAPVPSSDGTSVNVSGVYRNEGSTPIVSPTNSGKAVTQLDLRQNGSNLEAIDNNNKIFRGTIGSVTGGNRASFNMTGQTTAGRDVTISGSIVVAGDTGKMSATWIEPDFYATISAEAIGPSAVISGVKITGSGTINAGKAQSYTATGGDGTKYSWTTSDKDIGSLSDTSGPTVTYTAETNATSGVQTLTVSSGGKTGSITITHQP